MTKAALEQMMNGTKEERLFLAEQSFMLFAMYYFKEYFIYPIAEFHKDFNNDLHDLVAGRIKEVAWIAFRESAKTSYAKMFIVWLICFNKRFYINVDSFDKENAERILFDIVFEMVNNQILRRDFGVLFSREKEIQEIKQNRINNFITQNGIRVEAHSTQESVRGRIHLNQRPDFLLFDDIETNKTKDSEAYTKQVRNHLTEAMSGMSTDGFILYLGNYITEYGNIQWLMDRSKEYKGLRIRNVPVMVSGYPTWPGKYVLTDEEAIGTNKVSIEDKQRQLGSLVFSYEMMNKPIDEAMAEFKIENAQYLTERELAQKETSCYITIDSAVSEKESADYTGITVNKVDINNKWYIHTYRMKINTRELIDHMFYLFETYKPQFLGLEETTFTQAIQPFIQEEMRKRNKFFVINPVKHKGVMKELRIRGLIPRWENKSIFLVGDNLELKDEMRTFPNGANDDVLDSLSMQISIAKPPRFKPIDREEDKEVNEAI